MEKNTLLNTLNLEGATSAEVFKLLDFLPYPFIIAEEQGPSLKHLHFNSAFISLFGYTLEELPKIEDWFSAAYPDETYRNALLAEWNEALAKTQIAGRDYTQMSGRITTKFGNEVWCSAKMGQVGKYHLISFINQNDDLKKQEMLETFNENNITLLSLIGHDIREPLANLVTLIDLFEAGETSKEEFIGMVKQVKDRATQVHDLVETTVRWAKTNFNNFKVVNNDVGVLSLVNKSLAIFTDKISKKKLTIKTDISDNARLITDTDILNAIIRNLLANAIKFSGVGSEIKIDYVDHTLSISDEAGGMSPKMVKAIFDMEYQTDTGNSEERGIGIGLKLVQEMVSKLGAKLEVKTEENMGTTVSILLRH